MPSRQDVRRWSAKLSRSIELGDGTELGALADAAQFITTAALSIILSS